jgi:hypothetical protein
MKSRITSATALRLNEAFFEMFSMDLFSLVLYISSTDVIYSTHVTLYLRDLLMIQDGMDDVLQSVYSPPPDPSYSFPLH